MIGQVNIGRGEFNVCNQITGCSVNTPIFFHTRRSETVLRASDWKICWIRCYFVINLPDVFPLVSNITS